MPSMQPEPTLSGDQAVAAAGFPAHPLLHGLQLVGRGEHALVFDAGNGRTAFKLTDCPLTHAFHAGADRPRGPHYPALLADHGEVGRTAAGRPAYLVEIEKLLPLAEGSDAARLAALISRSYFEACRKWTAFGDQMGRLALGTLLRTPLGLTADLHEALAALEAFVEDFAVLPDLVNPDNIMMRADGTLVFSDPVYLG